ncbi:hypothetical protein H4R33_000724 [Dimargaris cristalligena]|nr:hypothetical protein H4R33_000724 [Dimargaris cristalligena]
MSASPDRQAELRARILQIMKDDSIPSGNKPRLIQALISPAFAASLSQDDSPKDQNMQDTNPAFVELPGAFPSATEEELKPTYSGDGLGCPHYQRGAKMYAKCCGRWFTCRICHDEATNHTLDRKGVKYMMCMHCQGIQEAGQVCSNMTCNEPLGEYYCDICHMWNNDPELDIFHCNDCQMCLRDRKDQYQHCFKCVRCISETLVGEHKCRENSVEVDCPICGEFLQTSRQPITIMRCGHTIHLDCLNTYMDHSFQCPVCQKSIGDMTPLFKELEKLLDEQVMPAEYATTRSIIFCGDCEERSETKYHFLYHKCQRCNSFSTKVLKTFKPDEDDMTD